MASDCILIQNEQLEQVDVDTSLYLGSLMMTEDGECSTEFLTRLNRGQAIGIGASLQKIWNKSQHADFNKDTNIRLKKALVWAVAQRTVVKVEHSERMKKHGLTPLR